MPKYPDHLSISQLGTLTKCPQQWYLTRIKKVPYGFNRALAIGKMVDAACNKNYYEYILTKKYLSLADVLDAAADEWHAAIDKHAIEDTDEEYTGVQDEAAEYIRLHYNEVQLKTIPKETQFKIELTRGDLLPIIGYIDVIEEDNTITDTKTSKKKYADGAATANRQLLTYWLGLEQMSQNGDIDFSPGKRRFDVVVKNKKPYIQQITCECNPGKDRVVRFWCWVTALNKLLKSGLFPPCTAGWWCNKNWCDAYEHCGYHE